MASLWGSVPPVDPGNAADTSIVPEPCSFADGSFFSSAGNLYGWLRLPVAAGDLASDSFVAIRASYVRRCGDERPGRDDHGALRAYCALPSKNI